VRSELLERRLVHSLITKARQTPNANEFDKDTDERGKEHQEGDTQTTLSKAQK
jgi:hypothetical protein